MRVSVDWFKHKRVFVQDPVLKLTFIKQIDPLLESFVIVSSHLYSVPSLPSVISHVIVHPIVTPVDQESGRSLETL